MMKKILKNAALVITVLVIIFSMSACGTVDDLISGNFSTSKVNGTQSRGNIYAGSSILYYEGYIYFSNSSYIYKVNENTKETEVIHTYDSRLHGADYIDIADGWLYFKDMKSPESDEVYLYKMRPDGEELECLCDTTEFPGGSFNIVDGYIYFGCEGKYSISKNEIERIYDTHYPTAYTVNVYENRIYFCDDDTIYSINTDGEDKKSLYEVETIYMIVEDGWIYFQNRSNYNYYKMKTDGSELQEMENINNILNFDDEWFYVSATFNGQEGRYKLKKNGTEYKLIYLYDDVSLGTNGTYIFNNTIYTLNKADGRKGEGTDILYKWNGSEYEELAKCPN